MLCLEKIFSDRDTMHRDEEFSVTCSYLEVYNEVRPLPGMAEAGQLVTCLSRGIGDMSGTREAYV